MVYLDIQVWGFWFLLVLLCGSWRPPWPTILRKPPAPWINLSQNPLRVLDCRAGWHKRSHISSSLFLGAEIWIHFWRVVEWCWMFKLKYLSSMMFNVQTWNPSGRKRPNLVQNCGGNESSPHVCPELTWNHYIWVHLLTFPFCNYWDSSDLTCKTWGFVCFLLSSSGHYRFITNNLGLSCGEFWCSRFARHMDLGSDNLRTLDMGIMKWLMKQWQCHRFDYTVTSMKRWVKKKEHHDAKNTKGFVTFHCFSPKYILGGFKQHFYVFPYLVGYYFLDKFPWGEEHDRKGSFQHGTLKP